MNKKRVSIIIPVYNLEKYIGRCVGSLLKQTYTNYEILLIDNGSLDKSKSIIDKLAKENIDIVKHITLKKMVYRMPEIMELSILLGNCSFLLMAMIML